MAHAVINSKSLCDQIIPELYLGPVQAEQANLEQLQQLGITHVLRLGCSAFPKTPPHSLHYCEVDVRDHPDSNLL